MEPISFLVSGEAVALYPNRMAEADEIGGDPLQVGRKRLRYRSWHRGTREADLMIGGFFDAHRRQWGSLERDWFSGLLQEQDVDIMAWAIGTAEPPARFQGPMMQAMQRLDYLKVAK